MNTAESNELADLWERNRQATNLYLSVLLGLAVAILIQSILFIFHMDGNTERLYFDYYSWIMFGISVISIGLIQHKYKQINIIPDILQYDFNLRIIDKDVVFDELVKMFRNHTNILMSGKYNKPKFDAGFFNFLRVLIQKRKRYYIYCNRPGFSSNYPVEMFTYEKEKRFIINIVNERELHENAVVAIKETLKWLSDKHIEMPDIGKPKRYLAKPLFGYELLPNEIG